MEQRLSIEHAGEGDPPGGALVWEEVVGKQTPGSGDLTFLTMEPNTIGDPGNQAPTHRDSPPPSSFCCGSLNKQHVLLCSYMWRLQAEEIMPCTCFPSLGMLS